MQSLRGEVEGFFDLRVVALVVALDSRAQVPLRELFEYLCRFGNRLKQSVERAVDSAYNLAKVTLVLVRVGTRGQLALHCGLGKHHGVSD